MGRLVVAIFVALTIADALTTYVGVAYFGLREGNPMLWFVNYAPWAVWPVALAQIVFVYFVARRWDAFGRSARSVLTRLLLAAAALRALAVVNNAAVMASIREIPQILAPLLTHAYLAAAVALADALRAAGKPTSFSKSGRLYLLPWRRLSSSPWPSWPSSPP
jgi:hypothetical protein